MDQQSPSLSPEPETRPPSIGPISTTIFVVGTTALIFFLGLVSLLSLSDQLQLFPLQSRSPIPVQLWLWVWLTLLGSTLFLVFNKLFLLLRGIGFAFCIMSTYVMITNLALWFAPPPAILGWRSGWPHLLVIGINCALYLTFRPKKSPDPIPVWRIGFAAVCAFLITLGFPFWGALGNWSEIMLALIQAFSIGSTLALALWGLFLFAPQIMESHPISSRWMANLYGLAFLPILFAGRGEALYGVYGMIVMGVSTILMGRFLIWPRLKKQPLYLAPLATFLIPSLFIILISFEGIELEYMPLDLIDKTTTAAGSGFFAILTVWLTWALFRLKPPTGPRRYLPLAVTLFIMLPAVGVSFRHDNNPTIQPREYFVVMADQADSQFLEEIEEREARVLEGYRFLTTHATDSQANLQAWLDSEGIPYRPFYLVNGLEIVATERTAGRVEEREDVAFVLESPEPRPLKPLRVAAQEDEFEESAMELNFGLETTPPEEITWGIKAIRADQVWGEFDVRGAGIIVGIADSGVMLDHPNLIAAYHGDPAGPHDYHWFDPHFQTEAPIDGSSSHGTHVAGTILGINNTGVAPEAEWIACRNLPRNLGNPADYLDCMQFLFAPFPLDGDPFIDGDPLKGAHLTNNSWGCPAEEGCNGKTLEIGIQHLRHAGQLMVVSVGNAGPSCRTSGPPAMGDAAFSVGASTPERALAGFSSRGPGTDLDGKLTPKPDIVAPGAAVLSSIGDQAYAEFQGTSMASPHVSGVVALIWSANPTLIGQIDATEELIRQTAQSITPPERESLCGDSPEENLANTVGAGLIDAYAAVESALSNR